MSPAWVHDFAATAKYAIIIEHPLYMQLGSLLLNTPATHIFSK
jgi:carotenoid cleavage dioxygenase-like enzyme